MIEHYTYLLVDFFCIIVPFIFSFHKKIKFNKEWKNFVVPCIATTLFFIAWDILFTEYGIWQFNPRKIIGIYFFNLPIEEVLFFICIPYACVFTYHVIRNNFKQSLTQKSSFILSVTLIIFLINIGTYFIERLYTSVTFFLLAFLLIGVIIKKSTWLGYFYLSFAIILPPFFISNGILTGSWIDAPVVLYNNNYNLQIRLFTIPFEDVFYGMLLLLMNITGFELLKKYHLESSIPA